MLRLCVAGCKRAGSVVERLPSIIAACALKSLKRLIFEAKELLWQQQQLPLS